MGLFSSKKNIRNETCYKVFVDQIGFLHYFFIDDQKANFTKDTIEGVKLYGAFLYHMEGRIDQMLSINNQKTNKEQKYVLREAISLVRDSLFEKDTNEIKECIEKFSSYHKKTKGMLNDQDKTLFKDPAFGILKKLLAQNRITFVD